MIFPSVLSFATLSLSHTQINKKQHMETFCTPLEGYLNLFKKLFSITPQNHLLNFIYFGKDAVTDVHYYTMKRRSECRKWLRVERRGCA